MRVISLVYRKGGFNYVFEKQKDSFHRIIDRVSFNMDKFSSKCEWNYKEPGFKPI